MKYFRLTELVVPSGSFSLHKMSETPEDSYELLKCPDLSCNQLKQRSL